MLVVPELSGGVCRTAQNAVRLPGNTVGLCSPYGWASNEPRCAFRDHTGGAHEHVVRSRGSGSGNNR
ncbi:hypothetical protein FTUN_6615 [Frigoriglobus tundricola]|uniref:Uncharacterized protein n=1 Tax=Frigoriglobus tundricola TaxID=2774151 RepID=A0A6M5YYB9_9BACT|nr:hypothetical protein FTUN_6615 [Frigoriglobus tundricola]